MISDNFLAILFPDLPEDHQNRSQTENVQNESKAPKLPTTFLSLPSELRQDILIRSYHLTSNEAIQCWNHPIDNGREWLQDFHRTQINAWANTLLLLDEKIIDDVEYVRNQWLEGIETLPPSFLPCCYLLGWQDLTEDERKVIWTSTQTGEEPWKRIHRKLYVLNRQWYYAKASPRSVVRGYNAAAHPPWDKQGGTPRKDENGQNEAKRWKQGPSRIMWEAFSSSHHPSTWKRLQDAVDVDIAWIVQTEKEYQEEIVQTEKECREEPVQTEEEYQERIVRAQAAEHGATSGNPPESFLSGIVKRLTKFRGLF
ncbi:hypothetical protein BLS_000962 [Venturia inaequalis]|uniref:Uncharacterized protein n=1 Tax=Venturia inaequalis TaxID=5025 RepID=A0A8H3Z4B3_VENIN|nr:hypothetical protein BLS_000962 [Venturia inaequalis]KAE9988405.1 hypothetical protein EG328_011165 [Venturia inaequalis]